MATSFWVTVFVCLWTLGASQRYPNRGWGNRGDSNTFYNPRPENLKSYLNKADEFRLLTSGGAANPYPTSLAALQLPITSMWEESTQELLSDIQDGLRYVLQTKNNWTFALHGTGSTAISSVLDNLIEPGDKVLVTAHAMWGNVVGDAAERLGATVQKLEKPLGSRLTYEEIAAGVKKFRPKILYIIHGESSVGVLQPLEGLGELCHKYNCITVVDLIATVGQIPIKMDERKLDVVLMNSQKGLGGIVGLAPVSFSPRAVNVCQGRKTPTRNYQTEMTSQARAWFVDRSVPSNSALIHSISLPLLHMLREGLSQLVQEGIENVWRRHEISNRFLHENMAAIGLEFFVPVKEDRLPGTTTFKAPTGKDVFKIEQLLLKKYKIEVSPGMGPTLGQLIRIGLFGHNARVETALKIVTAMRAALDSPETDLD